jgi:hypothetical protein
MDKKDIRPKRWKEISLKLIPVCIIFIVWQIVASPLPDYILPTPQEILFAFFRNIREAVLLGDRIILMTARPGKVKSETIIDLERPRDAFDPRYVGYTREVFVHLEKEIEVAFRDEMDAKKPSHPVG